METPTSLLPMGRTILITILFFFSITSVVRAQQSVAIGDTNVKSNAVLYLKGNGNQGLIIPIVTSTGAFGEKGMLVFNSSDNKVYYHNGSAWVETGGSGGGTSVTLTAGQNITITGAFPNFTISAPNVDAVVGNEVTQVNSTRGGLEITGAGTAASPLSVGIIQGTADGQILKWNNTTQKWVLSTDNAGGSPTVDNVTIEDVSGLRVKDNGISTIKIANDAVTRDKIAADVAGTGLVQAANGSLNVDAGTTANKIVQLNATGQLPAVDGSLLLNLPGGGDITGVTAGSGLTGGGTTGTVALAVDAGTTANKIVQLDGTGKLPAVDGSQLTNLPGGGDITGVTAGTGITGGGATGTVTVGVDVGTTANKIVQLDATGKLPAVDGSQLTNLTGDISAVAAGTGLTGGGTTGAVSLAVDVGTTANKIVQLDGTGKLPAVDGSLLTNLPGGGDITGVTAGTGITGGGTTGTVTVGVDVGTTANKIVQLNGTGQLPAVDGSLLTGVGDITGVTAGTGLSGGGTTGTVTLSLPNSGVTAATYGSATAIPQITVDAQGRITVATTAAVADASATNEIQNLTFTGTGSATPGENFPLNISSGTGVTIQEGSNITMTQTGNVLTINASGGGSNFSTLNTVPKGDGTSGLIASQLLDNGTNVGIGVPSPLQKLDINGNLNVATGFGLYINNSRFLHNTGTNNTFMGIGAGTNNTAINNTFIGTAAGQANTSGAESVFVGRNAGVVNTTGAFDVYVGKDAALTMTSGNLNTFVGFSAGGGANGISGSTFIGADAGDVSTGGQNTFIGEKAGQTNTSGAQNTMVGRLSGSVNTTGTMITLLGHGADVGSSGLTNATAIGHGAIVTASNRIMLGKANTAVEFNGALMPNGLAGTAGQVLTSAGAGAVPVWSAASGWGLTGNSGTTAGTNFIGTTDDEPFEIKVNGTRVFRFELDPNPTTSGVLSPNIIGGYFGNTVAAGVKGATISGGGLDNAHSADGDWATIGGGRDNHAGAMSPYAAYATVSGGASNNATGQWSAIGGGRANVADGNASTIPGGHYLIAEAYGSTVVGTANVDPAGAYNTGSWVTTDPIFIVGNGQVNGNVLIGRSNAMMILKNGRTGIGRTPTANLLEVEGEASKTVASAWAANSDRRIKTDIRDIDNGIGTIMQLRPVMFKYTDYWKSKHPTIKDQYYYNFIAQEYQKVFPNAVKKSGEFIEGDPEEVLQIDTYDAQIVTIKAVQELIEKVEKLEKENEQLKQDKATLENKLFAEIERIKETLGMEAKATTSTQK